MIVYGKLTDQHWHRVLKQDENGCLLAAEGKPFEAIWDEPDEPDAAALASVSWTEFLCPLPDPGIPCRAYALTYESHRRETGADHTICFDKSGPALLMSEPVHFRKHLDYEGEIGLLLYRERPDQYGYLMVNDLTDRGIQAREYRKSDPEPGFSHAKSFDGSLRVGPLLAIGNEEDWPDLEIEVRVNGVVRQTVRARDCSLTPAAAHRQSFSRDAEHSSLLVATGTSAGIVFRPPNMREKLGLLVRSGFSVNRGRERWLDSLPFLEPGDRVEMRSASLGLGCSVVTGEL